MRTKLLSFLVLPLVATLARHVACLTGRRIPAACAGTYLISEDGGARDFWTFERDGSFFGTTSTQPLTTSPIQQGTWGRPAKPALTASCSPSSTTTTPS
ncbi:MAG: hypothetical protein R3F14_04135 [Polyangiaceae bacterium]